MIGFIENRLVAKTFEGLEGVLHQELQRIGARNTEIIKRAVAFDGDLRLMYKINYLSRTALRVLKTIAVTDARNEQELYDGVAQIPWEDYFSTRTTIAVDGVSNQSNLTHSQYIALKTKDAIVDRFREKYGKRPNVDTRNPDVLINIRIFKNKATISLDSSGAPLYRRGYRKTVGIAPINEVLAAGLIQLSHWDKREAFLDPMCGAGTIAIEAALLALRIPAGYYREEYAFQHWRNYDRKLWAEIKDEYQPDFSRKIPQIYAWDKSGIAIQKAKENIKFAGLNDYIQTKVCFFEDTEAPEPKGQIITNPPYGERIGVQRPKEFYRMIGDTLKQKYLNWQAWIISSDLNHLRFVGLRPTKRYPMLNGQLESHYVRYDIYEGSKKPNKNNNRHDRNESPGRKRKDTRDKSKNSRRKQG